MSSLAEKIDLNKVATHPLQTSYWSAFRKDWGNEILTTDYGMITLHRLPFTRKRMGVFFRGPEPTAQMLKDLKTISTEKELIFIRMEPNVLKNKKLVNLMRNNGAVPGKTTFTPTSFWIDLTKTEEELLKSFHSKTRYNIKVAKRKGVVKRFIDVDGQKKVSEKEFSA